MIRRTTEFLNESSFKFHEDFGLPEYSAMAQAIGRGLMQSSCEYKRLVVPLSPKQNTTLTYAEIQDANEDSEVLYLLLGNVDFAGDMPEPKVLYKDGAPNTVTGKMYGNVLVPSQQTEYKTSLFNRIAHAVPESELKSIQRKLQEAALKEFMVGNVEARKRSAEEDVRNKETIYKNARQALMSAAKAREDAIIREAGVRETLTVDNAEIEEALKEFGDAALLRDFKYDKTADRVTFYTNLISITDASGNTRPIGEMEVTVDMPTSDLKIYNHDNRIDKDKGVIPHPHVNDTGHPCLGSIGGILPELVAARDLLGMWQIICSFLTSYNHADTWGKRLVRWPAYDKEGNPVESSIYPKGTGTCVICSRDILESDGDDECVECAECGSVMHLDCSRWSESSEEHLCDEHAVWCDTCDDYHNINTTEMGVCHNCGGSVCDDVSKYSDLTGESYCCYDCLESAEDQYREDHKEDEEDYEDEE